jgi:hypothetical protein
MSIAWQKHKRINTVPSLLLLLAMTGLLSFLGWMTGGATGIIVLSVEAAAGAVELMIAAEPYTACLSRSSLQESLCAAMLWPHSRQG